VGTTYGYSKRFMLALQRVMFSPMMNLSCKKRSVIKMPFTLEENVLILFDSGVFKDRIALMVKIPRYKVDEIIDGRRD
jgi:hypothetical protein